MNLTHSLTILIQGKNLAGPALAGSTRDVEGLASKIREIGEDIASLGTKGPLAFKLLGAAITGVLKLAGFLATSLVSLGGIFLTAGMAASQYAAKLETTSRAFQGILREGAPAMLKALQENSRFMLTDLRLQEQYVSAYMLTGDVLAKRIPEAYQYLSKVALATHDDLDFLVERLYRSVGRLSTRWMAYIGTVVEMDEAQAHAARMFDTTTDALTREQIQAGMLDRVLQKLALRTATLPEVLGTTEQMAIALKTSFKNLWGEFGTHFLPIARIGTSILLKLVAVLDMIISKGGPLYKFFRTFAATVSVVGDALSELLDQFLVVDNKIFQGLEELASKVMSTAWKAFSWGVSIATNLAAGLIRGAATAITAAINYISRLLAYWLSPHSPPRIVKDIVQWGTETMEYFLKGFSLASYDILGGVQRQLESVLGAFVTIGEITSQDAARIFLDISADMIEAISELQASGQVVEQMFQRLAEVGGGFGEHLVKLMLLQIDYSKAVERVELATRMLTAAEEELEDSQKHLLRTTDEYYMLLLTGASYEELVAGRAARNAAQRRRVLAKDSLAAAEKEKKAADEGLEGLEDRLELQNLLIDQLTLLLQKQAELVAEEVGGGAGGAGGAGGGAGPEGFELPELEIPEIVGASIDQEFEDLKDRIRLKFQELWNGIAADWEASEAGQAVVEMIQAISDLRDRIVQDGPEIRRRIAEIVDPIKEWITEDLWNWVVVEWGKWLTWWETDGPLLSSAVKTILGFVQGDLEDTEEVVGSLGTAFLVLQETVETVMALIRGIVSLTALAVTGDWKGFGEKFNKIMVGIAEDLYKGGPQADEMIDNYIRYVEKSQTDFVDVGAGLEKAIQKGMDESAENSELGFTRRGRVLADLMATGIEENLGEALGAIPVDQFMLPVVPKLTRSSQVWSDSGAVLGRAVGTGIRGGVEEEESVISKYLRESAGRFAKLGIAITGTFSSKLQQPAEETAKVWSLEAFPTMTGSADTLWKRLEPLGLLIATWFDNMLKKSARDTGMEWSSVSFPEMSGSVVTAMGIMFPIFTNIATWLGITLPVAGETLKSNQKDVVWPGITEAVSTAWTSILPIFEDIKLWAESTLDTALTALKKSFEDKMGKIETAVSGAKTLWDKLVTAVQTFWNWLQGKEFKIKIKVDKPDDAEYGSPLKIHQKFIDFANFLDRTVMSVRLDLPTGSSFVGLTDPRYGMEVPKSRTGQTHIYIERLILEDVQNAQDLLRQLQEMV